MQTPIFPPELQQVEGQIATGISNALAQSPLAGQYTGQMPNPEYAKWQQEYGGIDYPMPTNQKYYTLKDDPTKVVIENPAGVFTVHSTGQQVAPSMVSPMKYYQQAPPENIADPNTYVPGSGFLEPQPQQIAPLAGLEQQALDLLGSLANSPLAYETALNYGGQAGGVPSNAAYYSPGAFEASPYFQTAKGAFEAGVAPQIENQMALSGLGRSSSLADSLSQGWASILPSVLSQYSTQYVEPQLGREENALSRMAALVGPLTNLGGAQLGALMQGGALERGVEQAGLDAVYKDMLRRQALTEESLFTPMGMLFPSAIGQELISSGTFGEWSSGSQSQSGGGGGLFK